MGSNVRTEHVLQVTSKENASQEMNSIDVTMQEERMRDHRNA
jgi:hypothetical protein